MRLKNAPTGLVRTTGTARPMSEVSRETYLGVMHDVRHATPPEAWSLTRGATVIDDGVRFEVWAPNADLMSVEVWDGARIVALALQPIAPGVFGAFAPGVRAGADYRYRL